MSVTIVGAGPTGLTLACGLLMRGVEVRIVDAAPGPTTTSRAIGLQPRGAEVLRRIGALGTLPEEALAMQRMCINTDRREVLSFDVDEIFHQAGYGPLMLVSQAPIEASLRRRFAQLGGVIEWATAVVAASQDSTGTWVELSSGERLRSDWLVGCDGAHSIVRRSADIEFRGTARVERFWMADAYVNTSADHGTYSMWMHNEGVVHAFPLPSAGRQDLWRLAADAPLDRTSEPSEQEVLEFLGGAVTRRTQMTDLSFKSVQWATSFRIRQRLADRYRRGRMLIAGDAAHIHSPIGGQGMNTGIGDAENLAWKLALVSSGRASEALLDTYAAERRPVARASVAATGAATRATLSRNPLADWLRTGVLSLLAGRRFVQDRIASSVSQMSVSYRRGPLGSRRVVDRGPIPGDRVPNLRLGGGGALHDVLDGRWAVVATDADTAERYADRARTRLGQGAVVPLTPMENRIPASSEVMLVRPDGHLAVRTSRPPEVLDRWLQRMLENGTTR
ncbi:FAD-dependent monooxygenase [Rhodococcus daqingensis]|uniref:FAD-dependent monooxygenase n=1 Tax=Rhodococcus daqingensis TaxID=2479363 RepID=A0ABW2RX53_9NOCA